MKVRVIFTGRKAGAIGISYRIGQWFDGEGATEALAVDAARAAGYAAGYENLHADRIVQVPDADRS